MLMGWRTLLPRMVCAEISAATTCLRVSKARMVLASVHGFFRRTDAMMCHVFLLFIVTDDLALQMASSRPLGASGCDGGPRSRRCPTDGKELALLQSLRGACAPRHTPSRLLFQPRWRSKRKSRARMSKQQDERDENSKGSSDERTPQR